MKIEAVVFDMDGLMFDTETRIVAGIKETLKEFGIDLPDFEKFGYVYLCGNRPDSKQENMMNILKVDLDWEAFWSKMLAYYQQDLETNGVAKKEGLIELLDYLKKEKIKTAIASSSPKLVDFVCGLAGVPLSYFDCFLGGDDVKHSKPHPEIYQVACKKLGVNPKNAIALEDSDLGIMSASGAGMIPILIPDIKVNDPSVEKLAFKKLKSLREVIDVLKNWKE